MIQEQICLRCKKSGSPYGFIWPYVVTPKRDVPVWLCAECSGILKNKVTSEEQFREELQKLIEGEE